jgi:hypothetical protein
MRPSEAMKRIILSDWYIKESAVTPPPLNKIECGNCDGCGEEIRDREWVECSFCYGTGEVIEIED